MITCFVTDYIYIGCDNCNSLATLHRQGESKETRGTMKRMKKGQGYKGA